MLWVFFFVLYCYDLLELDLLGDFWLELLDVVIYLVGQIYVLEVFCDFVWILQINFFGILNLFQVFKVWGFFGIFLYISFGDVYGQVVEVVLLIYEEFIFYLCNFYVVSKLVVELLCLQWGIIEGWWVLVV